MARALARDLGIPTAGVEDIRPMIDLSQLSDEEINREYWRRVNARRDRSLKPGGRPAVLRLCPHCGDKFGAAELRTHKPGCKASQAEKPAPEASQGPAIRLSEARRRLQDALGPHAWMNRITSRPGHYAYVSSLGPVDIVTASDAAASPARCLELTLLHSTAMKGSR